MTAQTGWTYRRMLGILVFALLAVLALLYWNYKDRNIPEDLIGEWNTTDPNYSDRYFSIGPTTISFTTGNGTVSTGVITEIKTVREGSSTLYTIGYNSDGTPNALSFYYKTEKVTGSVIRFKNQKMTIWTKIDKHLS
jgi:hypothetical protein